MMLAIRALLLCTAMLGLSCVLPASSSRDARGDRYTGADGSPAPDLPLDRAPDRAPDRLVIGPADTAVADAGEDALPDAP